jgi:hypothetical protein
VIAKMTDATTTETIFEALRADHEIQRRLIDDLVDTVGNSDVRQGAYAQLRVELAAHAAAEERYFYVPLMESDTTQDQARHSVAEHQELDDFVEQLDGYDMSGPQWIQTARVLRERLIHHLDEEEHGVFQLAGKVLSATAKAELATEYRVDMDRHRRDGG